MIFENCFPRKNKKKKKKKMEENDLNFISSSSPPFPVESSSLNNNKQLEEIAQLKTEISISSKKEEIKELIEETPIIIIENNNKTENEKNQKTDKTEMLKQKYNGSNKLIVSSRQRRNKVFTYIKNVSIIYEDGLAPGKPISHILLFLSTLFFPSPADFHFCSTVAGVYIELSYHILHSDYIINRIKTVKQYKQIIVLCHVDVVDNSESPLRKLAEICYDFKCTLLLGWSLLEVCRYLETLKLYENKPATVIQEKRSDDFNERMRDCLTTIRSVNKTDVIRLSNNFPNLKSIINADIEELIVCPGILSFFFFFSFLILFLQRFGNNKSFSNL